MSKLQAPVSQGKLNEIVYITSKRPNGTTRISMDFQYCPTLTEQHTSHLTDINYLIEKYKPDELAAYIAAKNSHRQEIIGHDFSKEPNLQDGLNTTYELKQNYKALPEKIKMHFKNHIEFLKFIDNPDNQEKIKKLGLMTQKQIDKVSTNEINDTKTTTTPTQETKE